ncbi:MAG: hypothetical protein OXG27_10415 [Chloroflexi bacterium]|nr:hypothetical protein [Chloroflexota bacterium]
MTELLLARRLALTALLALPLLVGLATLNAHDDDGGETVRVIARLHEGGQIEFGLRTSEGNQFPRLRIFPANVSHGRWLRSSTLELPDGTVVRIIARRGGDARVEFGIRIDEPLRDFLPTRRFFPRSATVGRWLSSTPVLLPAPETDADHQDPVPETPAPDPDEPDPPQDDSDDSAADQPDEGSGVERISGGSRDGLIVEGNIIGDPDAPVLIVEYGDPF